MSLIISRRLLKSQRLIKLCEWRGLTTLDMKTPPPQEDQVLSPREKVLANQASMDHMLVPSGSWSENYNKRQPMYNLNLLMSTVALLAAAYFFLTRGFVFRPDYTKSVNLKEIYGR